MTPSVVPAQQVVNVLSKHENVSIFVKTIKRAGVDSELNSDGPYTIFAPSNKALSGMSDRLDRASSSTLRNFVMDHVMTGMATKRQIMVMSNAPTLGGVDLQMTVDGNNNVTVNGVSVIEYNIRARNGVIHIIDGTLDD